MTTTGYWKSSIGYTIPSVASWSPWKRLVNDFDDVALEAKLFFLDSVAKTSLVLDTRAQFLSLLILASM